MQGAHGLPTPSMDLPMGQDLWDPGMLQREITQGWSAPALLCKVGNDTFSRTLLCHGGRIPG